MKTFDKKCPQCGGDAVASPKDERNMIWCPQCSFEGTLIQVENMVKEKSNQKRLKI